MKNFVTKSRQCDTDKKINILRYINQQIYYISSVSKSLLFETGVRAIRFCGGLKIVQGNEYGSFGKRDCSGADL